MSGAPSAVRAPCSPAASARRGAALPFVLAALVVGALCAAGAASVARAGRRDARGAIAELRAGAVADAALARVLARWPPRLGTALAPGRSTTRAVGTPAGSAEVTIVRLDAQRFALEARAEDGAGVTDGGPAVRRHALLAGLRHVAFAPAAAVTAGGPVTLAAGAEVAAGAHEPPGWTDCPPVIPGGEPAPIDAAVAAPAITLTPGAVVTGVVRHDSAAWMGAVDAAFGDARYADLAAAADVRLVIAGGQTTDVSPWPRAAGGTPPPLGDEPCALTAASWGDPWRGVGAVADCVGALRAVHAGGAGTLRLRGPARLQGAVLVDGDLDVVGLVDVAGLLVVRGAVRAAAGALRLDGALVAGGSVDLGAGTRVRASPCALRRSASYAARAAPLARRAWAAVAR